MPARDVPSTSTVASLLVAKTSRYSACVSVMYPVMTGSYWPTSGVDIARSTRGSALTGPGPMSSRGGGLTGRVMRVLQTVRRRAWRTRDRSLPRGPTRQTPTGATPSGLVDPQRRDAERGQPADAGQGGHPQRGGADVVERGVTGGRGSGGGGQDEDGIDDEGAHDRGQHREPVPRRGLLLLRDGRRDLEATADVGAGGAGVLGEPLAVRAPRLGGLDHAERLVPLVEGADVDELGRPAAAPRLEGRAGRRLRRRRGPRAGPAAGRAARARRARTASAGSSTADSRHHDATASSVAPSRVSQPTVSNDGASASIPCRGTSPCVVRSPHRPW